MYFHLHKVYTENGTLICAGKCQRFQRIGVTFWTQRNLEIGVFWGLKLRD